MIKTLLTVPLVLAASILALPPEAGGERASPSAAPLGFELVRSRVSPKQAYFAGKPIKVRYRFSAQRRTDLRITVTHLSSGRTVAAWRERDAVPGRRLSRRWNGVDRRGGAAPEGRYEVRIGPRGRVSRYAGRFRMRGHVYPVDGPHGARGAVGEFGAGRNGGRVHEGFDIVADCGTPLVAARGGRVRKAGYDDRLYGWYVLIAGSKTKERYFYSHLLERPPLERGDRVRTGARVGRVGQTGNARSTPCHLHFELRIGSTPIDPEPELRRWDRWS